MEWQVIQIGENNPRDVNSQVPPNSSSLWDPLDLDSEEYKYTIFILLSVGTVFVAVSLKQQSKCHRLTEFLPESGCLMIIGCLISLVVRFISTSKPLLEVNNWVIEHVMIAPIILHASYELYHPHFIGQLEEILVLAIVATMLNAVIIAAMIYGSYAVIEAPGFMNFFHSLMYGSIISAVDPVAVLAVFNAVNADKALYFLVFGESLLNDGVTYVMFEAFKEFTTLPREMLSQVPWTTYLMVGVSFLTKPLGGAALGFILGLGSAFVTKHSSEKTKFMKPLINILFAASAYCIAIIIGFSGILCLIAFGLTQERYTFNNISPAAALNTTNLVRGVAVIMETLLFFILGAEIPEIEFQAVWSFALATLATIVLARTVVTFALTYFINKYRLRHPINWKWQVLLIAGGLRGAIAYAMSVHYSGPYRYLFYDTTVLIIFITTIGNGVIAKPLVIMFKLKQDAVTEEDFDYNKYYGWDERRKGNYFARWWYWFEDQFLLEYFTKDHRKQCSTAKAKLEIQEEKVFDDLDKDIHKTHVS